MGISLKMQSSQLLSATAAAGNPVKCDGGSMNLSRDPRDAGSMGVKPYTSTVALAMTLNYIIGTGCFGLPYAFSKAGLVLTSLFLIVGGIIAMFSMNYTLESLARAEGVTSSKELAVSHLPEPKHGMTYRKFDFCTVADIFTGSRGKNVVQAIIWFYCLATLWSYASVFASSAASMLIKQCDITKDPSSSCEIAYCLSVAVYGVIVIALVVMDIGEQAKFQKFLSIYRIVALIVMLITMCIKIGFEGSQVAIRAQMIGSFNWEHFAKGFGPSILAINCHYNMPDALQPLDTKGSARMVTFFALGLSSIFYLALGLMGALAFDQVDELATLRWTVYTACGNGWEDCGSNTAGRVMGYILSYIVLFFPMINVLSAYPMIGVTVGDNIFTSVPKSIVARFGAGPSRTACRLFSAIPPLILAAFFRQLNMILTIGGLFGFLLGLTIPCCFQLASLKFCKDTWGTLASGCTEFTEKRISSIPVTLFFCLISLVLLIIAIITL